MHSSIQHLKRDLARVATVVFYLDEDKDEDEETIGRIGSIRPMGLQPHQY